MPESLVSVLNVEGQIYVSMCTYECVAAQLNVNSEQFTIILRLGKKYATTSTKSLIHNLHQAEMHFYSYATKLMYTFNKIIRVSFTRKYYVFYL